MNAEADTEAMTTVADSRNGTRVLNIKAVPESIWRRARCNAARSGLKFRDYVIRLLAACQPFGEDAPGQEETA